jgi:hypothetical protein
MDEPVITANEMAPRTSRHTALLWVSLLGSILFNVIYFSYGAIAVHYNMMRQSVDELELLHYGWIQSVNFIVFGLSICIFAVALRKELQSGFGTTLLPLFHLLTGVGVILMGVFIHEPEHSYVGIISFVLLQVSFILLVVRLWGYPGWKGWTIYTLISIVLMVLFLVLFYYANQKNGPYAGVLERMVVVVRLLWIFLFLQKLLSGARLAPAE